MESGYYPPGAEFDPNAPYNQKDPKPKSFEVTICTSLSKSTKVSTIDYSIESDGEIDTSDVCWGAEFNEQHKSVADLIDILKTELQNKLKTLTNSEEIKEVQFLIKECEGWNEDEINVFLE